MVAALLSSLALGLSISPPRVEPLRWAFDTVATLELGLFPGLRLGVDIERRTAGGKGDGIYALRTIPEGATVGRYEGVVIKRQEYMDGELSSDYVFDLGENVPFMLDAQDPTRSNWCRFMNHNVRRANVEACMSDTGCFVYFEAGKDMKVSYNPRLVGLGREVRMLSMLGLALVMVEWSDVVFALDSIPAVLAVAPEPFIVFTSNILAILGGMLSGRLSDRRVRNKNKS